MCVSVRLSDPRRRHYWDYGTRDGVSEIQVFRNFKSEQTLNEIPKLLTTTPALKLRVEGYTDNVGQAAANQALSERRAQAVVAWLTRI